MPARGNEWLPGVLVKEHVGARADRVGFWTLSTTGLSIVALVTAARAAPSRPDRVCSRGATQPPSRSLPPLSALVGLAAGLGLSIPLAHGDTKSSTIPVTEIKEGMKGYGLSVFHGMMPERFDV